MSRNIAFIIADIPGFVTPRERRVSRNPLDSIIFHEEEPSRLARGV